MNGVVVFLLFYWKCQCPSSQTWSALIVFWRHFMSPEAHYLATQPRFFFLFKCEFISSSKSSSLYQFCPLWSFLQWQWIAFVCDKLWQSSPENKSHFSFLFAFLTQYHTMVSNWTSSFRSTYFIHAHQRKNPCDLGHLIILPIVRHAAHNAIY